MKKILFLYNPIAGQAKIRKNMYEVVSFYEDNNCLVTLCCSKKLPQLYDETENFEEQFDTVVCSGGDGTLNLVVSFFMEKGIDIPVGYLPAGSTNDYANSIGIPKNTLGALKKTLSRKRKYMDMGNFNGRYFLYVAAFGIFTKVSYTTPQKNKNLLGHAAYLLEGMKELPDIKSYRMTVHANGKKVIGDFMIGMITNSMSVGGFKNVLAKSVDMDDGLMEVLLVKRPSNLLELQGIIFALLSDNPGKNENIICFQSASIQIEADDPVAWTLDGEYGGRIRKANIDDIEKAFSLWL